ncbi:MAG: TolC family protein [Magnetococcus sp. YQC-3]
MFVVTRWMWRAIRSPVASILANPLWTQPFSLRGRAPKPLLRATVVCVLGTLWLLASLLSAQTSPPYPQEKSGNVQTFWIAVDNAQARSPLLQRQGAMLRAARETDPQSLAKLLPTVSAVASKTLDDTTRYHQARTTASNEPTQVGLSVTQPIFNYTNLLGREQSLPHIEAAVADLEAARQEVVVRTATLAANWLEAREVYALSARYAEVTARHAHIVGLRFKAGESTETEVHEAQSRAAQAVASRINARNVMDKAAASFAEVVGEPPAETLILPEFSWQEPAQFERRLPEFVEARADIRAARARMQESEITTKMRRSEHAPSVRFTYTATHTWDTEMGGSSGRSLREDTDSQTSMILMDVPIFNGGALTSRTRQAQAEWESQVADVDRLRLLAVRETQEARMDMANLQLAIAAQEQALQYSQRALTGLQEAFLAGTRTILELLDAQYEALTIQTNLVRSRYQHRLARVRFWAAVGWPLVPEHPPVIVAESGLLTATDAAPPKPAPPPARPVESNRPVKPTTPANSTPATPVERPPPVAVSTVPVIPESGRRPEVVVQPIPAEAGGWVVEAGSTHDGWVVEAGSTRMEELPAAQLPKMGFGPYYVCVGVYPDQAALRPLEQILTEHGIPTLLETARLRDSATTPSTVVRMLVGPFADFTDLQLARKQVEGWSNSRTGWVRNRHWPAPVVQEAASSAPATANFITDGPFYGKLPLPEESPMPVAHGPLFPHLSDGPFYIHLGAFATEEERERVAQKVVDLRLLERQQTGTTGPLPMRRDTLQTVDGRSLHRLLCGPFDSYEKGLQAKRAIQKETGIQTGWVDNPRWEEHQHCPNENLLRPMVSESDDVVWQRE